MNEQIYHLRHAQIDPLLQAKLHTIIYAYRPHDPIPTKQELQEERLYNSALSLKELVSDCKQDLPLKYRDKY